jgi:hypothetical protein
LRWRRGIYAEHLPGARPIAECGPAQARRDALVRGLAALEVALAKVLARYPNNYSTTFEKQGPWPGCRCPRP